MNTIIKATLTAACIVVLVWPLLFWGKPALPENGARDIEPSQQSQSYNMVPRHDVLW